MRTYYPGKIRYLRNKTDGFIYEWDPILDKNPRVEEVTEEEAYPERFVAKVMKDRAPDAQVQIGLTLTPDMERLAAAEEHKPGAPSDDDIALQLARRFK